MMDAIKTNSQLTDNIDDKKVRKKVDKKSKIKKERKKRDWVGIVHRICRIGIFRTLEAVAIFVTISMLSIFIGSSVLPTLAFTVADGSHITQSTDFYTACATWLLPMLFYALLIVCGTLTIFRKFIKWLHNKITGIINTEETAEKESNQK